MEKPKRFPQLERNLRALLTARYGKQKQAEQLAIDMGISTRTAYRWIRGDTVTDLDKLAKHLGVPESRLLHVPLEAVEAYIRGPGQGLPEDVKQALLDLQASFFGTATPGDERVEHVADELEVRYRRGRNRPNGDQA